MALLNLHPETHSPRLLENLSDIPFAINEHLLSGESILRPKQKEAVGVVSERFFSGVRALAMIMPTGTGKTVIIAQMLKGLKQDEQIAHRPKRVLIVTDSKEGIKQTKDKLDKYADIVAGAYYSDEKDLEKNTTVTTYLSWQRDDFPINPEDIDLVILDEAHKGISASRLNALKKYKNAVWMALTASPTYSEEHDLLEHFDVGYKLTIQEAVEHKLICGFRNILLRSDVEIDLEEIGVGIDGEFNEKNLARALNIESRNRIAAKYLLNGMHPDTGRPLREIRGIISCVNIKHAEDIEEYINSLYSDQYSDKSFEHGFVRAIHGASPNRDDLLKWHKEGKIGYLAYADLLNQNYDDYKIGLALNLRLSRSKVLVTQRGGRPERLDQDDLGKIALIVDVFDTYKGVSKKRPLFYADAIGAPSVISGETINLARQEKVRRNSLSIGLQDKVSNPFKESELKIITNEEELLSVLHHINYGSIRDKNENDLSIPKLAEMTGLSIPTIHKTFDLISEQWKLYEVDQSAHKKPNVTINQVKNDNGKIIETISDVDFDTYRAEYLKDYLVRAKTNSDLSIYDISKITGLSEQTIDKSFKKILAEWIEYESDPDNSVKPAISIEKVKSKTLPIYTISIDQFEDYKKIYLSNNLLEEKMIDQLVSSEIEEKTKLSKASVSRGLSKLKDDWELYNLDPEKTPPPLVMLYKVKFFNQAREAIHDSQLDLFKRNYLPDDSARSKTDNDLTVGDLVEITGLGVDVLKRGFKNLEKLWNNYNPNDLEKPPAVFSEKVKGKNGKASDSVTLDKVDAFIEICLPDKLNDFLKNKDEGLKQWAAKNSSTSNPKP